MTFLYISPNCLTVDSVYCNAQNNERADIISIEMHQLTVAFSCEHFLARGKTTVLLEHLISNKNYKVDYF